MPRKRSATDRAAEQADYATWKISAGGDLLERHDVKPGIIPEHLWRRLSVSPGPSEPVRYSELATDRFKGFWKD
jgi:hypothetical protein